MKSMQKKKLNLKRIDSILIEKPENTAETTSFSFETAISSLQDHATSSLLDISNQQYFPQSIQVHPCLKLDSKRTISSEPKKKKCFTSQTTNLASIKSRPTAVTFNEEINASSRDFTSKQYALSIRRISFYSQERENLQYRYKRQYPVNFLLSYDSIDKPKFNTGKIGTNQNTIIKINEQNREYRKAHSFIRKIESKETNRQNKSDALKNCSHRSRPLTCGKILRQRQKMNRSQELFQKQTQYCFSSPINLRPSKTIEIDRTNINFSHRGRKYLRLNRFSVNII